MVPLSFVVSRIGSENWLVGTLKGNILHIYWGNLLDGGDDVVLSTPFLLSTVETVTGCELLPRL